MKVKELIEMIQVQDHRSTSGLYVLVRIEGNGDMLSEAKINKVLIAPGLLSIFAEMSA